MSKLAQLQEALDKKKNLAVDTPQVKLKKLLLLKEEPMLAIFDEIQDLNKLLTDVFEREKQVIPPFPEFPTIPEADFTATNELLATLIDEVKKDKEVVIELVIE